MNAPSEAKTALEASTLSRDGATQGEPNSTLHAAREELRRRGVGNAARRKAGSYRIRASAMAFCRPACVSSGASVKPLAELRPPTMHVLSCALPTTNSRPLPVCVSHASKRR